MTQRHDLGELRDPTSLPERQRALHRAAMAAIARERRERQEHELTEGERRWPGLVNPPSQRNPRRDR